jgi:hypothetical protein
MRRYVRGFPLLLLAISLGTLFAAKRAQTTPLWAARTGNLCGQCHFDPNGGGPRNDYGFMFARNRHSIEPEGETSPWKDLDLTNRIGDRMPVYIGLNQRFMLLTNTTSQSDSLDRFGFFAMENSIHLTFQPHDRLALVYSRDAFSSGSSGGVDQKEAFGKITLPGSAYVKAGRFRNPFGLRMDDHTVATRNGYLDFGSGDRFLPYDPRNPDMGVELGGERGPLYGRLAFTNGPANVFSGGFAETKSVKVGYHNGHYQGGLSFYDAYLKNPAAGLKRATRWGYYGLGNYGQFVVIGEIAAGTDEAEPLVVGSISGDKTNLLAGFGEVDFAAGRTVNFRARYDYLNPNHSSNDALRAANQHQRYALEGEWVPVPFAELRCAVRRIDHDDEVAYGSKDETQFYTQVHFSY